MSSDPRERLEKEIPLTKKTLHDKQAVQALWDICEMHKELGQTLHNAVALFRSVDHEPVTRGEIGAALDFHGVEDVDDSNQSLAFKNRLLRQHSDLNEDDGTEVDGTTWQ